MNLMDWIFPDLAMRRREIIAMIDASRARMDAAHKAEQPIFDLAREVLPLCRAIELDGGRPTTLYLPEKRKREIELGKMLADAHMDRHFPAAGYSDWTLFGLKVVVGPELRVA